MRKEKPLQAKPPGKERRCFIDHLLFSGTRRHSLMLILKPHLQKDKQPRGHIANKQQWQNQGKANQPKFIVPQESQLQHQKSPVTMQLEILFLLSPSSSFLFCMSGWPLAFPKITTSTPKFPSPFNSLHSIYSSKVTRAAVSPNFISQHVPGDKFPGLKDGKHHRIDTSFLKTYKTQCIKSSKKKTLQEK